MAESIIKHPISDREELAILEDLNTTYSYGVYSDYSNTVGISLLAVIPTSMRLMGNYEYADDNQYTHNLNQYLTTFDLVTQANGAVIGIKQPVNNNNNTVDTTEFYVDVDTDVKVRVKEIIIKNTGIVMIRLLPYKNGAQITWSQINAKLVPYTPYVGHVAIEIDIDGFLRLISGQEN